MINYEQLVTGDTVHGSLYADPEVHAEEMGRIFTRGWVFVGHKSEYQCLDGHLAIVAHHALTTAGMPQSGSPVPSDIAGLSEAHLGIQRSSSKPCQAITAVPRARRHGLTPRSSSSAPQ
jgi:hypothetical protein